MISSCWKNFLSLNWWTKWGIQVAKSWKDHVLSISHWLFFCRNRSLKLHVKTLNINLSFSSVIIRISGKLERICESGFKIQQQKKMTNRFWHDEIFQLCNNFLFTVRLAQTKTLESNIIKFWYNFPLLLWTTQKDDSRIQKKKLFFFHQKLNKFYFTRSVAIATTKKNFWKTFYFPSFILQLSREFPSQCPFSYSSSTHIVEKKHICTIWRSNFGRKIEREFFKWKLFLLTTLKKIT